MCGPKAMCLCGASIVRGCRPSRRGARVSPFNKATSPARIYSSHRDHSLKDSAICRHATLVAPPPHRARAPPPAPSCFTVTPRRRTAPRAPPRRPTAAPSSNPAPSPELLRHHASPPHCASSSATSSSSSYCTLPCRHSSPHRRTELEPRHLWRTRSTTRGRATTARARRFNLCQ